MILRRLLLALLFACSMAAGAADQPWVEVNSPHFSVATDGGEKRAREVALRFEQMRTAFGVLFQKVNVNTAPLEIIAFRNSKELRQVSPLYDGKPIELSGFFLGNGGRGGPGANEERQFIALDLSTEESWGTIFHEYAHLLMNSNFPPSPVWFDEGFAEYCSSLKVDKKQISFGLVKPELPQLLAQGRWLKLVDLFSVEHESKIYNRDDRRSVFYAQSWLTVHFFMTKNMLKQVGAYLSLTTAQHVPVPEAIRRSFGMEPEALDKAIADYFRGGSSSIFVAKSPAGIDAVPFTSRSLNDLEIKTVMAELDFNTRDYHQRGITRFEEILHEQPENVSANRGLGYEALQKNDWDKAGEYFKRAAAQNAKDPQVHYLLAMMLNRKGSMGSHDPDDMEAIKKELNAAITLEPNYADAYSLLGLTLSAEGETEDAVKALTKAIALSPRNSWYSVNLANVYMRAQDFDHAVPILQELQKDSNPQLASMAAMQLQQVEAFKAAVNRRDPYRASAPAPTVEFREVPDEPAKSPGPPPVETEKRTGPVSAEPVLFMKGTLVSVDCSNAPAAMLTITSGGKRWKLLAPQVKKLIVMGANELSCSWTNRKVAVNYRKSGADTGNLVSLELE